MSQLMVLRHRSLACVIRVVSPLVLTGSLFDTGCVSSPNPSTLSIKENLPDATSADGIPVVIETQRGSVKFWAEVVDTPSGRQSGLMFRESLPEATGMLFVFPRESPRSFWMRNTFIPLDMVFIRSDKTILGIVEHAEPKTDISRSVPGKSQYVLELIGGSASRYRLSVGQTVKFYAPIPKN